MPSLHTYPSPLPFPVNPLMMENDEATRVTRALHHHTRKALDFYSGTQRYAITSGPIDNKAQETSKGWTSLLLNDLETDAEEGGHPKSG